MVVIGSLAISLVALVASIGSALIARSAQQEQRAVKVDAVAVANQLDRTRAGLGLTVSISNASLRPVIVQSASFVFDDIRLGSGTGYLQDVAPLQRIEVDPGRVVDQTRQLPFTIDVRSGRTVGIFVDDRATEKRSPTGALDRGTRDVVREWMRVVQGIEPVRRHRVTLILSLLPGGKLRIPVRVDPAMTARFAWQDSLTRLGQSAVSIGLRQKSAEIGQGAIFQLDIWSRGGSFHRTFSRPLIGDNFTTVPVYGLKTGEYLYAFRVPAAGPVTGCFYLSSREAEPPKECRGPLLDEQMELTGSTP